MGVTAKTLRRLLPVGVFGPRLVAVLEALALSIGRVREYLAETVREAGPGTATETLPDWYAELGLSYDATQTLATRRTRAVQAERVGAGQSLGALNEVIQVAFPDVQLEPVRFTPTQMAGRGVAGRMMAQSYPSWYPPGAPRDGSYPVAYYRVTGAVDDAAARSALLNLLDRVAPAEMEPVIGGLVIRNQTATAAAGLGMAGLMQAGRE